MTNDDAAGGVYFCTSQTNNYIPLGATGYAEFD